MFLWLTCCEYLFVKIIFCRLCLVYIFRRRQLTVFYAESLKFKIIFHLFKSKYKKSISTENWHHFPWQIKRVNSLADDSCVEMMPLGQLFLTWTKAFCIITDFWWMATKRHTRWLSRNLIISLFRWRENYHRQPIFHVMFTMFQRVDRLMSWWVNWSFKTTDRCRCIYIVSHN